jgi:hypothetical protein
MRMQRWGNWALMISLGSATGLALHCQTPPSHRQVGMGEDCASCHQSDFQSAAQPLHVGIISTNCAECHGNTSWAPARGSAHSWPLNGAHTAVACNACHIGEPAVYEGTSTGCLDCHQSDRDAALQPSHADFSNDCSTCHGTSAWQPAAFTHEWPLEGAHAVALCTSCHAGDPPVYDGTPDTCIGCHQSDRDAVVEPSHMGFSEDCGTCHESEAWRPADFPAHEWPLEGAHATATCLSCHGEPAVYDGTPTACVSCHETDRATVTEPPHDAFSSECQSCHGTASWDSADFEHTTFPLTGAHETAECSSCHTGTPTVFAGTARECVACHQQDYDGSPFPGHSSFATTCQDCHVTSGWVPASGGNHPQDRFSITGTHDFPCNDCHNATLGPNGAGNADCVGCHLGEHSLARMDAEHQGEVNDYPLGAGRAPNFCLQCHADGRE